MLTRGLLRASKGVRGHEREWIALVPQRNGRMAKAMRIVVKLKRVIAGETPAFRSGACIQSVGWTSQV